MYAPPSSAVSDNQLSNVTTPLSVDSSGYVITDGILFYLFMYNPFPLKKRLFCRFHFIV